MKRVLKWALRLVGVAGVLATLLLLAYVGLLPGLVERRLLASLRALGFAHASLDVRAVTLRSAEVANLSLDEQGRFRIGSLAALYDLPALLDGRIKVIEVTGAKLALSLRGGTLDLGPLANLQTDEGGEPTDLPFTSIELRACSIALNTGDRLITAPLSGCITHTDGPACYVDLRASTQGADLRLTGSVDTHTGHADLKLKGSVRDLGALLGALPPRVATLPGRVGGVVYLNGRLRTDGEHRRLALTLDGRRASFRGKLGERDVAVEDVTWRVEGEVGGPDGIESVRVRVDAGAATVDGIVARKLIVSGEQKGDGLTFQASAEGDGWRIETLAGSVAGLFGVDEGLPPITAAASWACRGRLPGPLVDAASARGVDLSGLGEVAVSGRLTATIPRTPGEEGAAREWEVHVPEMTATVASGAVGLAPARAVLSGVTARCRLSARVGPREMRLEVAPASQVAVASVRARLGRRRFAATEGADASLRLRVGERPLAVVVAPDGEGAGWRLDAPDLRLDLRRGGMAEPGLSVGGVVADVRVRLSTDGEQIAGALLPDTGVWLSSVELEGATVRAASAEAEGALLSAALGRDAAQFSLDLRTNGPWRIDAPNAVVTLWPADLSVPAAGVAARQVSGSVALRLVADPEQVTLGLGAESRLAVRSLSTHGTGLTLTPRTPAESQIEARVTQKGATLVVPLADPGTAWRLAVPRMEVALAPTDLEAAGGTIRARGLRAALPCQVAATAGEVAVTAPDRWTLGVDGADLRVGAEAIRVEGVALAVSPADGAPLLSIASGGGALGLRAAARVQTTAPLAASLGRGPSFAVQEASLTARVSRDPEATALSGQLKAAGIQGALDRVLSGLRLRGSTTAGTLAVDFDGRAPAGGFGELPVWTSFRVGLGETTMTVKGDFGDAEATAAGLSATGTASFERGREPGVEATIGLAKAAAKSATLAFGVGGLTASVPVSLNAAAPKPGRFAVESLRYGKSRLPGLSGTLSVTDGRIGFAAAWPVLKRAALHAEGRVDLSSGVPLGEVRVWLPRVAIDDEKELAHLLAEAEGIDLSGTLALDGRIELRADRLLPRITLKAEDVMLASKEYDAHVEGLSGTVVIDSFDPLSTPSHQRLEIAKANVGGLEVDKGVVEFRLESPSSVFIEQTEWGWARGRLYTYALRFDPAKPIGLVVYGDKLQLADLLALIPEDRATGEGELYGRLPVTVDWPTLRFGDGFLYATPGRQGRVRVRDAASLASGLGGAGATGERGTILDAVRRRFEAALGDFEYDVFRADFVREGGQLSARVFLKGRGPETAVVVRRPSTLGRLLGQKPRSITLRQEFGGITFNVPFFDEILSKAIIEKQEFIPSALDSATR